MRKSIRITTCLLLLFLFVPTLHAQKKRYDSFKDAIFSAGRLRGESGPSNMTWIENGDKYSFTKYENNHQEIWVCDSKSGNEELIFSSGDFTLPETDQPFRYRSHYWTKDFKVIFFQVNFKPVWRYSGNADYFYYSIETKTLEPVVKEVFTAEVSPDGKKIGYGKDGDLYLFDIDSREHIQLTSDGEANFYNGRFGWAYEEEFGLVQAWLWSADSRFIAFWQSDERNVPVYKLTDFSGLHPEYMEIPYPKVGDPIPEVKIGIIDIRKQSKLWLNIELKDGYIPRIYWTSRNNTLAVVWMNRKQNHLKLYFYNVESGDNKLVLEERSDSWIDIFDFFAGRLHHFYFPDDLEEFFWISERDNWAHIYRYDYEGELLNQVTKGEWEVIGIDAIDRKKMKLYYSSTEVSPLERHLYSIDFNGSGKKQLTLTAGNHSVNVSHNGKYYMDSYSDNKTPVQVELWTTKGKMLRKLVDNKDVLQYLEEHVYSPKELFSFETSDGQKLDGYLIKPVDFDPEKTYPVMLDIYGGPGSQSVYNSFGSNAWHQYLAQEGYVVADVNNRGNGGYGSQFEKTVYEKLGEWESHDFVETAKFLSSKPWIDGSRMAIRGHSYGGYTSSYTILKHPGVFKVALVGAPVTDHRLYDCIFTERYMGLINENLEGYEKGSVQTYAGNLEGHLLLAHSLMDENVHPQNTFQLVKALIDHGKDFDLKIYPPGAHGVAYNMTSYLLLMEQYNNYLNRYLKDE